MRNVEKDQKTTMTYGSNESKKIFCKKHEQFHPSNEHCPWCPVPEKTERSFESFLTEEQKKLAEEKIRLLFGI